MPITRSFLTSFIWTQLIAMSCYSQTASLFFSIINEKAHGTYQHDAGFVDQILEPSIIKKNKVKDITFWQERKKEEAKFAATKNDYDTSGYCTMEFIYLINYKNIWKYDNSHQVIEYIDSTSKKVRSHSLLSYETDAKGNVTKRYSKYLPDSCNICNYKNEDSIVADGCRDTCLGHVLSFTYDAMNHPVKIVQQFYSGTKHYEKATFIYKYDSKGRLVERREYDIWKYFYNKKGKLKKLEKYYTSGSLSETTIFTYDKKQRLISQLTFTDNNWGELEEFTYNENDLVTSWNCYRGNKKERHTNGLVFRSFLTYSFY